MQADAVPGLDDRSASGRATGADAHGGDGRPVRPGDGQDVRAGDAPGAAAGGSPAPDAGGAAVDLDARAAALDTSDPLAGHRARFVGSDTPLVYFDGNSLGRPLRTTGPRLAAFAEAEWGGRLIRAWDESWMDLPFALGDAIGRIALGAAPGQTVVGDSTTVLLYKVLRAALGAAEPGRDEVVAVRGDFPTDRFVVEAVAAERGASVRWVDAAEGTAIATALGPRTAVVVASHVSYASGYRADGASVTALVRDAGAVMIWDLSHSVGSVPLALDAWGADAAVGCTYKYLNGGPGSPAFCYVAARHHDRWQQPIVGWMGAADVFAMGPDHVPAAGMRRFLSGTPPILAMQPLADTLPLLEEVGIDALRAKSVALTAFAIEIADELLAPLGVEVASPRDRERRGGHVLLRHPAMRAVVASLWTRDVIPDFREPDGLRVGLSPLSTSFAETLTGLRAVAAALPS